MKATIEHSFFPYCDEVTELYFRIINTILFSTDEAELRTGMERLQEKTRLDDYFVFGYGKHHLWVCQRRPSNQKKDFRASGNHGRILMIQAGRNGIIFHSCHAAFPFLHLSLSFGCAISFCKNQPFVKSSVRFSEKQGSFLFPFCPLFFLPDGNMAVPRYPVPPFVATSLIFPSAVPQPVVSSVFCL